MEESWLRSLVLFLSVAALSNDTHAAMLVMSCVVPPLNVTVQVNCEVEPMAGTVPVTTTPMRPSDA